MTFARRFAGTVAHAAVAVSFFAAASLAYAHAYPKVRTPAADSTVAAPHEVAIEFDDALEPAFSSITVSDAQGHTVSAGKSAVDAQDKKHMAVAVGDLGPGVYTVNWVAVAADGHRTQGHYAFNVK
ncbi:copper resistance protein CopC [Paraburkholderia caballeronis]|uniref:CopC domain-containing protein n=1 Tax=Paraburkholderia caballeronis TaxID=416943 RepID=A0A1H7R1F4_9BURK|nr:copper resistance protein CopC [Paraburkholderia caballeronis]PXW23705.1 hypothetical protein C7403_109158 [Paraburkholderia caballeronis]PXW99046.1 hypothetical protein C7407_109158 [Paraburkholderia caballeronis]RAJ96252.1 hypothetical protein C7409_109158 [Paraburkholderia caballeronis]TDV34767.1 hypothetical protein C7405_107166 [Paraburkholderia caballeronis]SEC84635.1 hypothetical protein SAMN05445871_2977 [Paraburkholderia caballeronis]